MNADSSARASARLSPQLPLRLGRFVLCEELGSGGMATVYLTRMEMAAGVDRLAALKTIHPHLAKQKPFVDMFLDEARIAAQINHPHVCSTHDFGEVDGVYYLAMEYLLGEPLFDVVNRIVDRFDDVKDVLPYLAARIMADACEGLYAAHAATGTDGEPLNIVHRDVSPQNLFITYSGAVKVVDFGCAIADERVAHTSTGVMKGKVAYAAPEQVKAQKMDQRTDIWALGVCLWELLALSPLFARDTAVTTAMAVLDEEIELASDGRNWVPERIARIADKALRRNPDERYEDARAMGRELRAFIADSGTSIEIAEVAEWMEFLFEDRRADRLTQAKRVKEMQLGDLDAMPRYEMADEKDVELIDEAVPLVAEPVDDEEDRAVAAAVRSTPPPLEGSELEEKEKKRRGFFLWFFVIFLLGVTGFIAHRYLEPAPWFLEMIGFEPQSASTVDDRSGSTSLDVGTDGPNVRSADPDGRAAAGVGSSDAETSDDGENAATLSDGSDATDENAETQNGGSESGASGDAESDGGSSAAASSTATSSAEGEGSSRGARTRRGGRGGASRPGSSVTTVISGGGTVSLGANEPQGPSTPSAAQQAAEAQTSMVNIRASSGWAEIRFRGRRIGRTPLRHAFPVGSHRLVVVPFGEGEEQVLPLRVEAGLEETITVDIDE